MMQEIPCPQCSYEFTYFDGSLWVCPDCGHEWNPEVDAEKTVKIIDANGAELSDGDAVTIAKDLKIKGSSNVIKVGTKVKNIKLQPDSSNGHNIYGKVDGHGMMDLKSEFVKKVK